MAFETPCLSEPSRNGPKSTTLTVELFCLRSRPIVEATTVVSWSVKVIRLLFLRGADSEPRGKCRDDQVPGELGVQNLQRSA